MQYISDLVKRLEELKEIHGDILVCVETNRGAALTEVSLEVEQMGMLGKGEYAYLSSHENDTTVLVINW